LQAQRLFLHPVLHEQPPLWLETLFAGGSLKVSALLSKSMMFVVLRFSTLPVEVVAVPFKLDIKTITKWLII
jgi:hypothetical protein